LSDFAQVSLNPPRRRGFAPPPNRKEEVIEMILSGDEMALKNMWSRLVKAEDELKKVNAKLAELEKRVEKLDKRRTF
jgi:hypothetical protein